MNAEDLLKRLIEADGVFTCPRPGDFESGNSCLVFIKTVGKLVVSWDLDYILVGAAVVARTEKVYAKESVFFGKDLFGHLTWWKNAQRDLKLQVALARAQAKVDNLASLLS